MQPLTLFRLALAAAAASAILPAHAAVLVPVKPLRSSTVTMVFGINDSNTIVGSFVGKDDGVERGFFGPLNGKYKKFTAGDGGTRALAINNSGYIVGYSNSQLGETDTQPIFERKPGGKTFAIVENGDQLFGAGNGISNSTNKFAGDFWDRGDFAINGLSAARANGRPTSECQAISSFHQRPGSTAQTPWWDTGPQPRA